MSYQSERHRRKVMREMRLAGYDLPGTPYRHVNRYYRSSNNRSLKIRTSKINSQKHAGFLPVTDNPLSKIVWITIDNKESALYGPYVSPGKPLNDSVFIDGTPGKNDYEIFVTSDGNEIEYFNHLSKEDAMKKSKKYIDQLAKDKL